MLAEKKVSKKKNKMTAIGIVLVLIVTAVLLYFLFAEPTSEESTLGALLPPTTVIPTSIKTEVLDDARIKALKQYGPAEVDVLNRGRSNNPFAAF